MTTAGVKGDPLKRTKTRNCSLGIIVQGTSKSDEKLTLKIFYSISKQFAQNETWSTSHLSQLITTILPAYISINKKTRAIFGSKSKELDLNSLT